MKSVWKEETKLQQFDSLKNDANTDVLIIGGGLAGVLCAYALGQRGVDYMLLEQKSICQGVTANTTAKITSQHGLIYSAILKKYGSEFAELYLRANEAAVFKYFDLCSGIDCDFEEKCAYVYSLQNRRKLIDEIDALKKIGFNAVFDKNVDIPISSVGAVKFFHQAQFNPLKFVSEISKNLNIYENTKVEEFKGTTAVCGKATVRAKKIIVATHFPFINKHGSYFLKMYQQRSYVLALQNAKPVDGMYIDEAENGLSFRSYNDLLLLGGGGHRTGKDGGSYSELEKFTKLTYPNSKIKYRWATQDCVTLDKIPYIGNYSARTPDMYVATGFNKWGMTTSMAAATLLTDMVTGTENSFSKLFSPSRSIFHKQFIINATEAISGIVNFKTPRCPHLGCALKYNKQEKSWDCSCHGSRFSENGELLNNPATGDLKEKK